MIGKKNMLQNLLLKRNCSASSRLMSAIKREINSKQKGALSSFSW